MNRIIVSAAAAILLAGSSVAFAQDATSQDNGNAMSTDAPMDFVALDTNADGMLSLEEAQVAWPDLTQEEFTAADIDHNGSLSEDEANGLKATLSGGESTVQSTDQTNKTN
jgi:hypothetical protein